jgi:hemerythrin-like domain-containing protein
MNEHRVIEQMIDVMQKELDRMKKNEKADVVFIDYAVDFIKTYTDQCHHGKEEHILFRDLQKKSLSEEYAKLMESLIKEHEYGRELVNVLMNARDRYAEGNKDAVQEMIQCFTKLIAFYPKHIGKEDKDFFPACMEYFSADEEAAMLNEFNEFDRSMIHKKYKAVVELLKQER